MGPARINASLRTICLMVLFLIRLVPGLCGISLTPEEKEYLQSRESIIFVSQTSYPPFEFTDEDNQQEGIMLDVARWMSVELGFKSMFLNKTFQEAQEAVLSGKADIITSLFYSDKRSEKFTFTDHLFEVPSTIFCRSERTDIKDLKDLNGKTIAIQKGDYAKDFLQAKNIKFAVLDTIDFAEAVEMVVSGKADAVVGDEQIVLYHIFSKRLTERIKKVGEPLYSGQNCMAANKNGAILIGIFNKAIREARITGVLDKITTRWLGSKLGAGESFFERNLWKLAVAAGLLLLVVLWAWAWNLKLHSMVRLKTAEILRREEALRENEAKYKSLTQRMSDLLWTADLKGNVTFTSPSIEKMLGFSSEEWKERPLAEKFSPVTAKNFLQMIENDIEQVKSDESLWQTHFEMDFFHRDGSLRTMETLLSLICDDHGNPVGIQCLSRDITERRLAEEERKKLQDRLNRAEKMESLGVLAGGVAHDLNNTLGIIIGVAEMLLMKIEANSPFRTDVNHIMQAGERAAAIVQDLLTLARRGVQTKNIINLNRMITEFKRLPEFDKLVSQYPGIKISFKLEPDLLNISGSPVHLLKSLINLVTNAMEAMPGGGDLKICTANTYLEEPVKGYDRIHVGDYVMLKVSDTGEGIAEKDLKRIFEPFYTRKVMGKSGTGLGLAVVWGMVLDHDGYIDVTSEEGKGTVFTLFFPVKREELPEEIRSISIKDLSGNGESVLVVDDVKGQRDLAFSMLNRLNYQVICVASGEEAVEYLKTHKVDLVMLDMIMDPGIDGLDTYKQILAIHPKQKAVICSGFSESERVIEAQAIGAGAYIRKPYVLERIGSAVKKGLGKLPVPVV